jgi:phage-related protein
MIAPACSSTSPSGATVWAPAEPHSGGSYQKAIPKFEVISTKRLPKLIATLDDTEFPNKMFTTDDILNNGGRKLKEVRIGDAQGNPCRGLWFRTKSGNKRYFIFGSIFYKNTQKINAATNSEVAQANKIYDAVMKKLGNL